MADLFVCVRQRAGPLVKALVTDNYGYLRRYGPGAVRGRCGPALSRTTVDKLELRLALFGYDGIFYTLTFDDDHLPGWGGSDLGRIRKASQAVEARAGGLLRLPGGRPTR